LEWVVINGFERTSNQDDNFHPLMKNLF